MSLPPPGGGGEAGRAAAPPPSAPASLLGLGAHHAAPGPYSSPLATSMELSRRLRGLLTTAVNFRGEARPRAGTAPPP